MRLETDGFTVKLGVGNPAFFQHFRKRNQNIFQVVCTFNVALLCTVDARKPFPNTIDINNISPVTERGYNFIKNVKHL